MFSLPSLQNGVDDTLSWWKAQKEAGGMCHAASEGETRAVTLGPAVLVYILPRSFAYPNTSSRSPGAGHNMGINKEM